MTASHFTPLLLLSQQIYLQCVFSGVTCYGADDGWAFVNAVGGTEPLSIME